MSSFSGMQLGVTTFSFVLPYHEHRYSFAELVAKVAELDLGPGLEVDGFQCIRGFPHVSGELERRFKEMIERSGLELSCLSTSPDVGRRPDRLATPDEQVVYLKAQLEAARKLGFPVVWMPALVQPATLEKLLPFAERWNVKMGIEIGAPLSFDGPEVMALRELFDREQSPFLGFIPDFGGTTTAIAPAALRSLREDGVPEEVVDLLVEIWRKDDAIGKKRAELVEQARSLGADEVTIGKLMPILSLFGRETPAAWLDLIPYAVHIHGKFYEFDDQGNAVAVPYPELLPMFRDAGYGGYVSFEWGGQIWVDGIDAFQAVKQQHDLSVQLLARSG